MQGMMAPPKLSLIPHLVLCQGKYKCFYIFCRKVFIINIFSPALHLPQADWKSRNYVSVLEMSLIYLATNQGWLVKNFCFGAWLYLASLNTDNIPLPGKHRMNTASISLAVMGHLRCCNCQGPSWDILKGPDFSRKGGSAPSDSFAANSKKELWSHSQCVQLLVEFLLVSSSIYETILELSAKCLQIGLPHGNMQIPRC